MKIQTQTRCRYHRPSEEKAQHIWAHAPTNIKYWPMTQWRKKVCPFRKTHHWTYNHSEVLWDQLHWFHYKKQKINIVPFALVHEERTEEVNFLEQPECTSLVWKLQNLADQRRTKFHWPTIPDSPLVIWPLTKYWIGKLGTVSAEILSCARGTNVFLTYYLDVQLLQTSLFLLDKDELSLYVLSGMMLFLCLLWGTRTLCYSFIRDLWIKSHKCDRCGFVLV